MGYGNVWAIQDGEMGEIAIWAEDYAFCTHRARIEGNPKNGVGINTLSLLLTLPVTNGIFAHHWQELWFLLPNSYGLKANT